MLRKIFCKVAFFCVNKNYVVLLVAVTAAAAYIIPQKFNLKSCTNSFCCHVDELLMSIPGHTGRSFGYFQQTFLVYNFVILAMLMHGQVG